jgi:hypothetical protein
MLYGKQRDNNTNLKGGNYYGYYNVLQYHCPVSFIVRRYRGLLVEQTRVR